MEIFVLIPLVFILVPALYGAGVLILMLKRASEGFIGLFKPAPIPSVPMIPKITIKRRLVNLETKEACEQSIECTEEQVRAIFRNRG